MVADSVPAELRTSAQVSSGRTCADTLTQFQKRVPAQVRPLDTRGFAAAPPIIRVQDCRFDGINWMAANAARIAYPINPIQSAVDLRSDGTWPEAATVIVRNVSTHVNRIPGRVWTCFARSPLRGALRRTSRPSDLSARIRASSAQIRG
jgi:hypothetical protein